MTGLSRYVAQALLIVTAAVSPAAAQQVTQGDDMPMMATGIVLPRMDAASGRQLFAAKGCVVCHAVNGTGGKDAPPLDAANMQPMMNPFDFAAGMWPAEGVFLWALDAATGRPITQLKKRLRVIRTWCSGARAVPCRS